MAQLNPMGSYKTNPFDGIHADVHREVITTGKTAGIQMTVTVVYQALKIEPGSCYVIGVEDDYTDAMIAELEARLEQKFHGYFVVARGLALTAIKEGALGQL